jgi:hypothetical protein
MKTCGLWRRVPANRIDRTYYGRTVLAFIHPSGAMLLHHRPRSRNSRLYDLIGIWLVVHNSVMLRRQYHYGRRQRGVPWRWANKVLTSYRRDAGHFCDLVEGRRPTIAESITNRPPAYDELPATLFPLRRQKPHRI